MIVLWNLRVLIHTSVAIEVSAVSDGTEIVLPKICRCGELAVQPWLP